MNICLFLGSEKSMSFDAHEETIGKIFHGETCFEIPKNQRDYVWEEKHWKDLLNDIKYIKSLKEQGLDPSGNHFLGSFVLQNTNNKYIIIDGQQRITTLSLILASLCQIFKEFDDSEEYGITKQYLVGNIGLKSEYIRLKNDKTKNIQQIIADACSHEIKTTETIFKDITIDKSTDSNKRIINCFNYFYNYFKDNYKTIEELAYIRTIVLSIKVIYITSPEEIDCYDIFEVLNARGVSLQNNELLKNYIFKYSKPKYDIDKAKIIWDNLELELGSNLEQFLNHFVTYKYHKPSKENTPYQIIKDNTPKENVYSLLEEMATASKKYQWFYAPDICPIKEVASCLEYFKLINHRQFRPLFLSLFFAYEKKYISEKELIKVCVYLKNFSFAFTLVMKNTSNEIENKIYTLSHDIYEFLDKNTIDTIQTSLNPYYPKYSDFERGFLNLGYSNKNKLYSTSSVRKRIFYILKEIEEYKHNTNEIICNENNCNIEHIMNDKIDDINTFKVGNLLLISKDINSNMADKSFIDKKKKLEQSQLIGVKDFLKYYGDKELWTEDLITERTKKISALAYNKVWKI